MGQRPPSESLDQNSLDAREALAAGGIGLWRWNLESGAIHVDGTTRRLWGLPTEGPVSGARVLGSVDRHDLAFFRAAAARAQNPGGTLDTVLKLRVRDAAVRTRYVRLRGATASDGGPAMSGVTFEVDHDARLNEKLDLARRRLNRLQDLGGAVPFEWDAASDRVLSSRGIAELYGIEPGQPVGFGRFVACIHPNDRQAFREYHARLLEWAGAHDAEFRILMPEGRVRWILSRCQAVRDAAGLAVGVAGIHIDITARRLAEDDLRRSRREARARFRELNALYNNTPVGLALLDPALRILRANGALSRIAGAALDDQTGRPLFDVLPHLRDVAGPLLERVLTKGETIADVAVSSAPDAPSDTPEAARHWVYQFYPVAGGDGGIIGAGLVCEDVTLQRRTEEARDLLGRELGHRIKNLFAVVSSLVSLSARHDPAVQPFARTVRGRIEALGRVHDYVRPSGFDDGEPVETRTLQGLFAALLRPYRELGDDRIAITGPDSPIGPSAATALALALHEFATNAVKYGALSTAEGRVAIVCGGEAGSFALTWTETGGPAVEKPTGKDGFGTTLARRTIAAELGGTFVTDWRAEGLQIQVTAPAGALVR